MIAIRTDANEHIAMGHLMRCLTIAEALRQQGEAVIFFAADEYPVELIKSKGFEAVVLNSEYDKLESEVLVLCRMLKKYNVKLLLADTYYVTYEYLRCISESVKTAYIDDVAAFEYPVDMVINYAPYYEKLGYRAASDNEIYFAEVRQTKYVLGADYVPIRDEFKNKKQCSDKRRKILITTGGTDNFNIAGRLLKKWSDEYSDLFMQYDFCVVSGRFNRNLVELQQICESHSNVELIIQADNMAELMAASDMAVTAAGTTMYELCTMGVPSVSVIIADNQRLCAEYFDEQGLIVNCGYAQDTLVIDKIIKYISDMASDYEKRQQTSYKMKKLIDGNGAKRIAEELIKIV